MWAFRHQQKIMQNKGLWLLICAISMQTAGSLKRALVMPLLMCHVEYVREIMCLYLAQETFSLPSYVVVPL
ncbi:Uncharacterised protein [Klebsiella variicola]|nr:Uncharacterised protein [Klebsiella variicola]